MSEGNVQFSFIVGKEERDRWLEFLKETFGAKLFDDNTEPEETAPEEEEQLPLPPEEVYDIVRREAEAGEVVLNHAARLIEEAWRLLASYEFGGHTKAMFGPGTRLHDCYQNFTGDLADTRPELDILRAQVGGVLVSKMKNIRLEVEGQLEVIRNSQAEEDTDWEIEDEWEDEEDDWDE